MNKAFTLAEVLITLGIIGVVAAMTLPTLIQKNQDKELISRTKKVFSDINNAALSAQNDFGVIGDNSLLFNPNNTDIETAKNLLKYFNGAKLCKNSAQQGCSRYYYKVKFGSLQLDNNGNAQSSSTNWPRIILNNGAILAIRQYNNQNCYGKETINVHDGYGRPVKNPDGSNKTTTWINTRCAAIRFDINGEKNPNQLGRDVFSIQILKNKITPESASKTYGGKSLTNILTGNERLEYVNYSSGEKYDF